MSDTEAEPAEQSTPPKKTKYYEQKYCPSWESKDKIKGWLSKSTKGIHYFYCKSCRCDGKGETFFYQKLRDILLQQNIKNQLILLKNNKPFLICHL